MAAGIRQTRFASSATGRESRHGSREKTPKPCLPWLLAVRTGRAARSCPLMGKVGHENGNSLCHKAGPIG